MRTARVQHLQRNAMTILLLTAALLTTCASVGKAQQPIQHDTLKAVAPLIVQLHARVGLLEQLGVVWDSARMENKEALRCGMGYVTPAGVAWMDMLYAPKVYQADSNHVYAEGCPYATVFEWHTHLPDNPPEMPPTKRCFLSVTDQRSILREGRIGLFHMVHADKDLYCWWSVPQIMEHIRATQLTKRLMPVRGQTSW